MRISPIAAVALVAALAPASGRAASPDRYQITPAEGGFLRLDRENGATSFCSPSGDGYACRPATDAERRADSEASRIEKRLAAIEERLGRIESGKPAEAPGAGPRPVLRLSCRATSRSTAPRASSRRR